MLTLCMGVLTSCTAQHKDSVVVKDGKEFYAVKIEPKQTLYSLSKKYDVSQEDIKAANNGLLQGLKKDEVVYIPVLKKSEKKVKKEEKEEKLDERLKGLSDEIQLQIDSTKPRLPNEKCPIPSSKKLVKVGLILPFHLSALDTIRAKKGEYLDLQIPNSIQAFIDFYEGALTALDSLKRLGYRVDLYAYDDNGDTSVLKQILKKKELEGLNLLIGPVNLDCVKMASAFCASKNIYMISPLSKNEEVITNNPFLVKVSPAKNSYLSAVTYNAIKKYPGCNFIVIGDNDKSKQNAAYIKSLLDGKSIANTYLDVNPSKLTITVESFKAHLLKDTVNVVFLPTENQSFVTKFMNSMYKLSKDYKFALYGMESWTDYASIDVLHFQGLNVRVPSFYLNRYESPYIDNMIYSYVNKFKTEPSEYAFTGYDLTYIFVSAIEKNTDLNNNDFLNIKWKGMMQDYLFIKNSAESGIENRQVGILEFKNYQLVCTQE